MCSFTSLQSKAKALKHWKKAKRSSLTSSKETVVLKLLTSLNYKID